MALEKGAAGAVGVGVLDALAQEPPALPLAVQVVVGVVEAVAALAQHGAAVGIPHGFGGGLHVLWGVDVPPGKGLGLGDVGRHHRGQGEQLFPQGGGSVAFQQPGPAGGDHHRVHHHVLGAVLAQLLGDDADEPRRGDHAHLHRVGPDVLEHGVNLLA